MIVDRYSRQLTLSILGICVWLANDEDRFNIKYKVQFIFTRALNMKYYKKTCFIFSLFVILLGTGIANKSEINQIINKKQIWIKYLTPEEAGWSKKKLKKAKQYSDTIGSDAVMALYRGKVLFAWGNIKRRFMCHSLRKSFMSIMFGIYIDNKKININKTIEELRIDDSPTLSKNEKKATILNLLQGRSGIYHRAVYEPKSMVRTRPDRGSHKPGSFWFYNNWDFNTLCTIFEKETKKLFFNEFKEKIADQLGMEDFRLIDTYYHYENNKSIHPAYPFKMSTRDLARIGLLMAQNGIWNNKQIVSEKWVRESTKVHSKTWWRRGNYGYMWWISEDKQLKKLGMYSAIGAGGHRIDILPTANLVFVHRVNSFKNKKIKNQKIIKLIKLILRAKNKEKQTPKTIVFKSDIKIKNFQKAKINIAEYIGTYKLNSGFYAKIQIYKKELLVFFPDIGKFKMKYRSEDKFFLEDIQILIKFKRNKKDRIKKIEVCFYSGTETGILIPK